MKEFNRKHVKCDNQNCISWWSGRHRASAEHYIEKKKTTTNKHQPPYNRDWYYKQGMGIPNGGYWLGKDPTETVTYFMKFLKFIFRNWFQARLLIQCSSVAQTVFIWELTHTPLHKMAVISQTIYSNAFSRMKNFVFWFKCHWSLFLRV